MSGGKNCKHTDTISQSKQDRISVVYFLMLSLFKMSDLFGNSGGNNRKQQPLEGG